MWGPLQALVPPAEKKTILEEAVGKIVLRFLFLSQQGVYSRRCAPQRRCNPLAACWAMDTWHCRHKSCVCHLLP